MSSIRYTVCFPEPSTHYAEIEAEFPTFGKAEVELFMAVWTPGSYLVREYARHVENVTAETCLCAKTAKNRWTLETGGAAEIRVSYRVYCREMSVRTNWVEDSFALLNGAPTFLSLVGGQHLPHIVRLVLPDEWKTSITGLPEANQPHEYIAPDYDTLVDSPILAGNPALHTFDIDGIPHFLVNQGEEPVWDSKRAVADLETIVRHYKTVWGTLPYHKYVFLNLITEAGGGLEHRNSMVIMTSRWSTSTRKAYLGWLSLASHEFFHVWNVKRLRPAELGPFDYERENHTRSLWVAEGITDYYAPLALLRAGLSTRTEYLNGADGKGGLSGIIHALQTTPGRLVQSVELASFDAWIKLYRPDENSANTTISYYTKGTVVAWLLDARIRSATGGAKSLDDLILLAYSRFSGESGFTPDQFRAAAEEVAGTSLREFFRHTVESTEELDYSEALECFGLRFSTPSTSGEPKAWLGADTKVDNGRLVVTKILRGTPAHAAGLNVDDEILAFDDFRVRPDQLSKRLENCEPGQQVSLLLARRDKLTRLDLTLGEEPGRLTLVPSVGQPIVAADRLSNRSSRLKRRL